MGGTVQHGASTLSDDMFDDFPKYDTLEIHLATCFQNLIMDHPKFPKILLEKMYGYLEENMKSDRDPSWNDTQFEYKLRKKAWGPFKKESWEIAPEVKNEIFEDVAKHLEFLFDKLGIVGNKGIVEKYIKINTVEKNLNDFLL